MVYASFKDQYLFVSSASLTLAFLREEGGSPQARRKEHAGARLSLSSFLRSCAFVSLISASFSFCTGTHFLLYSFLRARWLPQSASLTPAFLREEPADTNSFILPKHVPIQSNSFHSSMKKETNPFRNSSLLIQLSFGHVRKSFIPLLFRSDAAGAQLLRTSARAIPAPGCRFPSFQASRTSSAASPCRCW